MQTIPLTRLRAEAKRQLLNYRKNTLRVYRGPEMRADRGATQKWIRAIDMARSYFRETDPVKERFMSRLFGLETAIPRNQLMRLRMLQLVLELNVSESTLYKWREDILEIVLYAAIESGLIRPFGLGKTARVAEETQAAQLTGSSQEC